jgi:glycosyltransferase involved in cell wall biosynthesis
MNHCSKTLSLVIPVYYNEQSLPTLFGEIERFEQKLAERGLGLELIFVNDGSGDNSLGEMMQFKQQRPATKVISLSRNFGAVAACKTGFRFVTGDCFSITAADLQDPIENILLMAEQWLAGSKFVIAVRAKRSDPTMTKVFASIYYWLVRWMVIGDYPRGGFDLMLMDKSMLPYMVGSSKNINPALYAYWLGFQPAVISYERQRRRHGKSRWTFRKKLNYFIDSITGFSVAPIRMISWTGFIIAMISFIYGAYMFVGALLGYIPVRGFATVVVLISFFSGVILLMLGVLGEYLWRIFDIVSNKPESVIDEAFL